MARWLLRLNRIGLLVLRLSDHSSGDFTNSSRLGVTLQDYISAMRYLKLLRTSFQVPNRGTTVPLWSSRFLSQDAAASAAGSGVSRYDPLKTRSDFEELFLDKRVRYLLKRLTGYNPAKVFASKSLANLNSPKYRFMTDEQLNMEREMADAKAEKMLQMPPVKYAKEHKPKILEQDPAIQGFLDPSVKIIFLDATPGYSDVERLIVVREADGTLREATREERHRTNQIFYPVDERLIELPKMLEDPHTEDVLNRGAYKILLDNACLHLEPEEQRYIDLTHRTYEHIASKHAYDQLQSTRHFGGMVYYYAYFRRADPMLHYLVTENRLEEAYHLLQLYYIINTREGVPILWNTSETTDISLSKLAELSQNQEPLSSVSLEQFINLFQFYLTNDATNLAVKPRLQLNLQKLQEQLADETNDSAAAQN